MNCTYCGRSYSFSGREAGNGRWFPACFCAKLPRFEKIGVTPEGRAVTMLVGDVNAPGAMAELRKLLNESCRKRRQS